MNSTDLILNTPLATGFVLVSWWKPLLFLPPFIAWAWLVATVYDKHAARFHLPRERWNLIHLIAGLVALFAGIFLPMLIGLEGAVGLLVGYAVFLLVLAIDTAIYPAVANKDPRVPEGHQVRLNLESFKEARARKAEAKQAGTAELVVIAADKSKVPVPNRDTPEFAVRVAAEQALIKGLDLRASQIDLAPASRDGAYAARYLVDGVPQTGDTFSPQEAAQIIDFWRAAAGMDLADRRKPQTGHIRVMRAEDTTMEIRVSSIGSQAGLRLSMKINPAEAVRRTCETLGLFDAQLETLREITRDPKGIVLLAAPPGQGRTTTLYSIVKMHDAYTTNVQTLEFEIEDSLEGVKQNVFDRFSEDQDFSKTLRSIVRRDPDVVGVVEVPDKDTAAEAARADLERTRIYLSLRARDAFQALQLWVRLLGDMELAARDIHGVVANRLLRKLCENCKVAYQPTPDMLKKLALPADRVTQLYKKGGQVLVKNKPEICPVCNGIGYAGQEGVFEVYPFTQEERELLAQGNLQALRAELRKKKYISIQQAALRKAVEGITSIEEVMRITAEPDKKKKSAKPSPSPSGA